MKRLISLSLALLMVAFALVGCTDPAKSTDEPEANTPSAGQTVSPSENGESAEATPTPEASPSPEEPTKNEPVLPADPAEVLKGKKALFLGDSIVHASTWDKEHYSGYGWPGRIKDGYGMLATKNMGRDGASLSTCRGDNLIYNHMVNNYANDKTQYDFVVLEGGVNDAWDKIAVGAMDPETAEETDISGLDRSTMAGGMEHLLYNVKKLYPKAVIIFVFNFKLRQGAPGNCGTMDNYIAEQKKICEKWDIPYCNLYEDKQLNKDLKVRYSGQSSCVPDGVHPNSKGYDLIAPIIAQSMADEYVKAHA